MTRIAVMQPYFIPYRGYFRLFEQTDLFVIYDCVQFPRRGRVHRNQLYDHNNDAQWLTLPIAKCPQNTLIRDISFAPNMHEVWQETISKFPSLSSNSELANAIRKLSGTPISYITSLLKLCCRMLEIDWNVIYSSSLNISPDIKGQDRIIEIAKRLNASEYINAPNGKALYDDATFAKEGINLRFLPTYEGEYISVAQQLCV